MTTRNVTKVQNVCGDGRVEREEGNFNVLITSEPGVFLLKIALMSLHLRDVISNFDVSEVLGTDFQALQLRVGLHSGINLI